MNPATGDVIGHAPDAGRDEAAAAIAAARRAFDTTSWSTDVALRVRCLEQLHQFGGFKQSGVGREMGVAGLEEFLERKTFAIPAVPAEGVA
jgi:acyl-CoA reductase-like NAD-dependent aldehyde dehydrogenase